MSVYTIGVQERMSLIELLDARIAAEEAVLAAAEKAGDPWETYAKYEGAIVGLRDARKCLAASATALEAELKEFRDKAEAERLSWEARCKRLDDLSAAVAALPKPPEPTPEERARLDESLSSMFAACKECGRPNMSSCEDEQCGCCGGCWGLREGLGSLLDLLDPDDQRPAVVAARGLWRDRDPRGSIRFQLKERLEAVGLYVALGEKTDIVRGGQAYEKTGDIGLITGVRFQVVQEGHEIVAMVSGPEAQGMTEQRWEQLELLTGDAGYEPVIEFMLDTYRRRGLIG